MGEKKKLNILQFAKFIGKPNLIIFALLFNLGEGTLFSLAAYLTGQMTNDIIAFNKNALFFYFVISMFAAVLILICIPIKEIFYANYIENSVSKIKTKTFEVLLHTKHEWIDEIHNAEITANVSNDINALSNALRPFIIMCFSVMVNRIVIVIYLFTVNPLITLIILCTVPVITYFQWRITKSFKDLQKESMQHIGKMVSVASDCFTNREVIKAMSLDKVLYEQFDDIQNKQFKVDLKSKWINSVSGAVGIITIFLPALIVVLVSALMILNGNMTIGTMMIFVSCTFAFTLLFSNIADFFTQGRTVLACLERITGMWNIPQQTQLPPNPQTLEQPATENKGQEQNENAIVFDHVDFSYGGQTNILNQCSFQIRRGEVICLSGASGSGKSTVLKLICNFYQPSDGSILINDKNIKAYQITELRRKIVYITQEAFLFSDSIYDNVTCFDENNSRELVYQTLSSLGLSEKIDSLPAGIDTLVGDRGSQLSGGERQRVAIARAVINQAEIILLDEIASGLDTLSEKDALQYFLELPTHPTIVFITHRLPEGLRVDRTISIKEACVSQPMEVMSV